MDNSLDKEYYAKYGALVCGVDEVGRGPLCGPVVAAAVILPEDFVPEGINDSKKLSEKKREKLYPVILENAVAVGIGESFRQARFCAYRRQQGKKHTRAVRHRRGRRRKKRVDSVRFGRGKGIPRQTDEKTRGEIPAICA